jgi:hypothetical protein
MKLNLIAILYWKRLCRIKEFDLRNQKHRLLVVIFWIIILSSITTSSVFLVKYNQEKAKYDHNEAVIVDFEAKFALNRCLENLKEEAQTLQEHYLANKNHLIDFFSRFVNFKKISPDEIFNTFQKVLSQVIYQDTYIEYTSKELAIFDSISKNEANAFNVNEYNIPYPNNHVLHNAWVFLNLRQALVPFFEDTVRNDNGGSFQNIVYEIDNATLKTDNFEYTDSMGSIILINGIDLNNLSIESAKMISSNLPENYQIENYFETQHVRSNPSHDGIRYVPSYLIDPFRKLTFFDPENFNPEDLKSNLQWAKITNNNILDAGYRNLLFIFSIIGANSVLIFIIRIINWIQNGH